MSKPAQQQYCEKIIYGGNAAWGGSRCSNKAKVEDGGKWYCHIHSPEAEARRTQKREKSWAAKQARWAAEREDQRTQEAREKACVAAFHSPDGREIATEKISEGLVWEMLLLLERLAIAPAPQRTRYEAQIGARALLAKLEE